MKVVIMTPSLRRMDAIGNDVIKQREVLVEKGFECHVYAEFFEQSNLGFEIISEDFLVFLTKSENVILFYHHALFWDRGEKLLQRMANPTIVKYHNITPASFYEKYDEASFHGTLAGREQTSRIVNMPFIEAFVGASEFNAEELELAGVPKSKVTAIAPFHFIEDFDSLSEAESVKESLKKRKVNVLFVGRIVPNKAYHHLINTIDHYIHHYGNDIHLNIIGSFSMADKTYYKELEDLVNSLKLGNYVSFLEKQDLQNLYTYYKYSDVFLLCSEHEGFCVPILEAQSLGLPIVALNRAAVPHTLGQEQVVIEDPDYKTLAAAVHKISHDKKARAYLIEKGKENTLRFSQEKLTEQTAHLITKTAEACF